MSAIERVVEELARANVNQAKGMEGFLELMKMQLAQSSHRTHGVIVDVPGDELAQILDHASTGLHKVVAELREEIAKTELPNGIRVADVPEAVRAHIEEAVYRQRCGPDPDVLEARAETYAFAAKHISRSHKYALSLSELEGLRLAARGTRAPVGCY